MKTINEKLAKKYICETFLTYGIEFSADIFRLNEKHKFNEISSNSIIRRTANYFVIDNYDPRYISITFYYKKYFEGEKHVAEEPKRITFFIFDRMSIMEELRNMYNSIKILV